MLTVLLASVLLPRPQACAQGLAPSGSHVVFGLAAVNGAGVQLGYLGAGDFFTREVALHADLRSVIDPKNDSNQIVFWLGGALRVYGIERTIGNVPYRGYDIDAGLRIGPAFSFSTRESDAQRNRRFHLFIEPFVRLSVRSGFLNVLYLEAGTTRPMLRLGFWLPF